MEQHRYKQTRGMFRLAYLSLSTSISTGKTVWKNL